MDNKNQENIEENNEELVENEDAQEFEDDLYLLQLHKRFIEMKKERKKAEQDAQLLGNRLNLLKGEEEKTWKKIEKTRKVTQEKVSNLQKMEEELRKKQEFKEKKEVEVLIKKDINQKMKSEIKDNIKAKRELKMMQIMEEARLLKEQKKQNEEMMNIIKIEEMLNNKNKNEYIKSQHKGILEKKKTQEMERKNKLRIELEQKLLQEEMMRQEAESKCKNLEEEEIEILKRIKTTTQVHKAVVEDLEKMNITGTKFSGNKISNYTSNSNEKSPITNGKK